MKLYSNPANPAWLAVNPAIRGFIAEGNEWVGIDGVELHDKRTIYDSRGIIRHGLRSDDGHAGEIGEVYFSTVFPYVLKAWHLHSEMTLRYLCIFNEVWVGLFDDRAKSRTRGNSLIVRLSSHRDSYRMLIIPPGVWNGFQSGSTDAVICNIASQPHDPDEITRVSPATINDKWGMKWPFVWRVGG